MTGIVTEREIVLELHAKLEAQGTLTTADWLQLLRDQARMNIQRGTKLFVPVTFDVVEGRLIGAKVPDNIVRHGRVRRPAGMTP